jgi:hypothetical protein
MLFRTARILRAYAHSYARLIMSAQDARGPEKLDVPAPEKAPMILA